MSLHLGENFSQRWRDTPPAVRQSYCDELALISRLLEPETLISQWQFREVDFKQRQRNIIQAAYEQLKQEILAEQARLREERRIAKQARLEARVAQQRAVEQQHIKQLTQQQQQQHEADTRFLQSYSHLLNQQLGLYTLTAKRTALGQSYCLDIQQRLDTLPTPLNDNLKIRLELEAEYHIAQVLKQLKEQLQAAAKEEIEITLAQQHS